MAQILTKRCNSKRESASHLPSSTKACVVTCPQAAVPEMSPRSQMEASSSVGTDCKKLELRSFLRWCHEKSAGSIWSWKHKRAVIGYLSTETDRIRKLPPLGKANCWFYIWGELWNLKTDQLPKVRSTLVTRVKQLLIDEHSDVCC